MTEYNNDRPQGEEIFEDVVTDPEFVEPHTAETMGEKLDDATADSVKGEDVDKHATLPNADQLSENIRKYANEAAYAAVGFAGLIGDKAKEFYEEQKRQYAASHPEADHDPGAKDFLAQLREKIDKFVEELTKGYKDMAERGRAKADGTTPTTETVVDDLTVDPADQASPEKTNFPE